MNGAPAFCGLFPALKSRSLVALRARRPAGLKVNINVKGGRRDASPTDGICKIIEGFPEAVP
jgi:hypothetical protein